MAIIRTSPSPEKLSRLLIVPIDPKTGEALFEKDEGFPPRRVPYFPESVTYSRGDIGWEDQSSPGLSHNLLSWTGNGNPTLSFEVKLYTEVDPRNAPDDFAEFLQSSSIQLDKEMAIDIDAVTAWFTALSNPIYPEEDGKAVQSPPVVQIVSEAITESPQKSIEDVKNTLSGGGGGGGGDNSIEERLSELTGSRDDLTEVGTNFSQIQERDFYGVLDSLEIEYEKWFPSGNPKMATINVTLKETIQIGDQVLPHSRESNLSVAQKFKLFD